MKLAGLYYFYGDGVYCYPKAFDKEVSECQTKSVLTPLELKAYKLQKDKALQFGNYFRNKEIAKEFMSMVVLYRRSRDLNKFPIPLLPSATVKGEEWKDMSKEINVFYIDYITGELQKDQVMKVTGILPQSDLYMRKAGAVKFKEVLKTLLSHYGFARH